jgi:hypothetical protein
MKAFVLFLVFATCANGNGQPHLTTKTDNREIQIQAESNATHVIAPVKEKEKKNDQSESQ